MAVKDQDRRRRHLLLPYKPNILPTGNRAFLETNAAHNAPPLRILVIGDSLAAGVGVTHSSTPVLPESIARTLSQRLGGRPVYWTCVGTPGASTARIVHDIESYKETLLVRQPTIPPAVLLTESWMQSLQKQWRKQVARRDRLQQWWRSVVDPGSKSDEKRKGEDNNQLQNNEEASPPTNGGRPRHRIVRWWKRLQGHVQTFQHAWMGDLSETDSNHQNDASTQTKEDDSSEDDRPLSERVDPFQLWQKWRQQLQRRSSLRNPEIVGQFDVAIVLTGLNDLKEATLPFMFQGRHAKYIRDKDDETSSSSSDSLRSELERVLQALQQRMALVLDRHPGSNDNKIANETTDDAGYTLDDDDKNVEKELQESLRKNKERIALQKNYTRRRPLVVFPALPVSPLPIFNSQPLRWFILPLFRRVDNYKREVAKRFPGEVLFVDAPTEDIFAEVEKGTGTLWDDRRGERLLLRLTDIQQKARMHVESIMSEYYEKWANRQRIKDDSSHYNEQTPEEAHHATQLQPYHRPGSSLISVDGIHPNDDGYEFWGRHIALAIIKEWESQDNQTDTAPSRD